MSCIKLKWAFTKPNLDRLCSFAALTTIKAVFRPWLRRTLNILSSYRSLLSSFDRLTWLKASKVESKNSYWEWFYFSYFRSKIVFSLCFQNHLRFFFLFQNLFKSLQSLKMLKDLRLWCPPIVTFYAIEWLNVMTRDNVKTKNLIILKMLCFLVVNLTSFCGLKM